MSGKLKALLHGVGGLAAAIAVGWIAWRFAQQGAWQAVRQYGHGPAFVRSIVLAIPLYAVGLCLAALAWCVLQGACMEGRRRGAFLFAVYTTTQFAKYLPGNIGHYVGRHVWLRRLGLGHAAVLFAAVGEAGMLVVAAAIWAAPVLPLLWPAMPWWPNSWICLATAIVGLLVLWLGSRRLTVGPGAERLGTLRQPGWLPTVLPLQLGLFGCMALAVALPAHAIGADNGTLVLLPAVVAASWIAGFVAVGAPAGIGVREVVFLALLRGQLPEGDILLLAVVFRVITFAGDLILFGVGLAMQTRVRALPPVVAAATREPP